ncbi:MAG TPA: RNA polymerase sigma factor [Gammaproteobacteria bacterium]|nr:RNA polymerase sigma factor [Gammaproteobacteria bacterium]
MSIIKLWSHSRQTDRFEIMLKPFIPFLYQLAWRFTRSQTDAEDLVQNLLSKLYPRLHELEKIDNLRAWLARVLYRQYVDQLRMQSRTPVDLADTGTDPDEELDLPVSIQPDQEQAQLIAQIDRLLPQLNDDQRLLLILHDVEGYTLNEIQTMTDTPTGTLKSRLNRARKKLRDLMEPFPANERVTQLKGSKP